MEWPAQSQCSSPPFIYALVAQSCSAWPPLLVQIKNLGPNNFRVRRQRSWHNLTRLHQTLHYNMTVCRGDPGAAVTHCSLHSLSLHAAGAAPCPRACPVPSFQWWWQFLTSKNMVSRVGNERQQEKAAGRAASLHKGSSLSSWMAVGHCRAGVGESLKAHSCPAKPIPGVCTKKY